MHHRLTPLILYVLYVKTICRCAVLLCRVRTCFVIYALNNTSRNKVNGVVKVEDNVLSVL